MISEEAEVSLHIKWLARLNNCILSRHNCNNDCADNCVFYVSDKDASEAIKYAIDELYSKKARINSVQDPY